MDTLIILSYDEEKNSIVNPPPRVFSRERIPTPRQVDRELYFIFMLIIIQMVLMLSFDDVYVFAVDIGKYKDDGLFFGLPDLNLLGHV